MRQTRQREAPGMFGSSMKPTAFRTERSRARRPEQFEDLPPVESARNIFAAPWGVNPFPGAKEVNFKLCRGPRRRKCRGGAAKRRSAPKKEPPAGGSFDIWP